MFKRSPNAKTPFARVAGLMAIAVAAQCLGATAVAEESFTESANKPGSELATREKPDETDMTLRSRATMAHLNRLRKPIHQIEIADPQSHLQKPENRAASVMEVAAPIQIASLGYGVPIPNRYTIGQAHRPLYFEQPNVERCGNGFGVFQNAVSGFTFLANTMALPYRMGKQPPHCEVPAGGDCRTCQSLPSGAGLLPLDHRGVAYEVLAIAAVALLLL